MIFCLVPDALANELVEPLRRHFGASAQFHVAVDSEAEATWEGYQRLEVPRCAWLSNEWAAGGVRMQQRLALVTGAFAEAPQDMLLAHAAAGDSHAATELYWRLYAQIDNHLCAQLHTRRIGNLTATAFGRILDLASVPSRARAGLDQLLQEAVRAVAAETQAKAARAEAPAEVSAQPAEAAPVAEAKAPTLRVVGGYDFAHRSAA